MKPKRAAREYALALFSIAGERKIAAEVRDDLVAAARAVTAEGRLVAFLESPAVPMKEKAALVRDVLPGTPLTKNFFDLMIRRRAFSIMGAIAREYSAILDHSEGREPVVVVSASALDKPRQEAIRKKLDAILGRRSVPKFSVDEDLIAGLVIRYRDRILDGSMKTQFKILRQELTNGH